MGKMNPKAVQGRSGDGLYKKRGIWYFKVVDWAGRRRGVSTRTRIYADAKEFRKRRIEEIANGGDPLGGGNMAFRIASQNWLERRLLDKAAETKRAYKARVASINAKLGDLPLARFTAGTLRHYQIERSEDVSPPTVNAETKIIVSVLKENHIWNRIAADFKRLREPRTVGRRLTDDEVEKLIAVAERRKDISVIFLVMRLLLETGLRHKEVRMLTLGAIDLGNSVIHVKRETTKTDAGERLVPMTDTARLIVADLLGRAAQLGAHLPHHCLFPGIEYKRVANKLRRVPNPAIPQANFRDAWQTLRRLAGVDTTLRIHDLRHHVATDLAAAGVVSAAAMRLMGWSSPQMMKRYEHLQDSALRRGMEQLSALRREQQREAVPKPPRGVVVPFARVKTM
jgi:integrase